MLYVVNAHSYLGNSEREGIYGPFVSQRSAEEFRDRIIAADPEDIAYCDIVPLHGPSEIREDKAA